MENERMENDKTPNIRGPRFIVQAPILLSIGGVTTEAISVRMEMTWTPRERWRLAWRSRLTGEEGEGEPVFDSRQVCQETADTFNAQMPELFHWPQSV